MYSCNVSNDQKTKVIETTVIKKELTINKNWQGDTIISIKQIIDSINTSCKLDSNFFGRSEKKRNEDEARCVLSKIKFDYEKLEQIDNSGVTIAKNEDTELKLKSIAQKIENNKVTHLLIVKNNQVMDSVIVYKQKDYPEALVVEISYFYISTDKLYVLEFFGDEDGESIKEYKIYNIDLDNGKFVRQ